MSPTTEKVQVMVDWSEVSREGRPEERVSQMAAEHVRLQRQYNDAELRWIQTTPEWRDSVRRSCQRMQGMERDRLRRVQINEARPGKDPVPVRDRVLERVTVTYPRPRTRTWLNRERKED